MAEKCRTQILENAISKEEADNLLRSFMCTPIKDMHI